MKVWSELKFGGTLVTPVTPTFFFSVIFITFIFLY